MGYGLFWAFLLVMLFWCWYESDLRFRSLTAFYRFNINTGWRLKFSAGLHQQVRSAFYLLKFFIEEE